MSHSQLLGELQTSEQPISKDLPKPAAQVRGRKLGPPRTLQCATAAQQSATASPKNPGPVLPRGWAAPARHNCPRHLGSSPGPRPARPSSCPGRGTRGAAGQPGRRWLPAAEDPPAAPPSSGGRRGAPAPLPSGSGPPPPPASPAPAAAAARPGPGYLGGPGGAAPPAAARSRARCRS